MAHVMSGGDLAGIDTKTRHLIVILLKGLHFRYRYTHISMPQPPMHSFRKKPLKFLRSQVQLARTSAPTMNQASRWYLDAGDTHQKTRDPWKDPKSISN